MNYSFVNVVVVRLSVCVHLNLGPLICSINLTVSVSSHVLGKRIDALRSCGAVLQSFK